MKTTADYLAKVSAFHRGKPKFMATIEAVTGPLADLQSFMRGLIQAFDLDEAIGVQLDIVGQWIGLSRFVDTPIENVWFSFDDAVRGFDFGVIKGPFDNGSALTRLDDDSYRTLLRAKIAANEWDGTTENARSVLDLVFADADTKIFIQDNYDMSMVFGMAGQYPSLLMIALFSGGYFPLKPEGVKAVYLVTSVNNAPLFGFDMNNEYVSGFDSGAVGVTPDYFVNHLT